MNGSAALTAAINSSKTIVQMYLGDITEDEMFVRAVPGINHLAWQIGHLVESEHNLIGMSCPGSMPALPADFAGKYTKETAASDDRAAFHSKAQLLAAMEQQRAGTLAILARLSDADLDQPGPEQFRSFCPTVGDLFALIGTHWTMHAGQWAVLRRKLGRAPLM